MERDGKTFCDRHPKVETSLRCSRCEAYICPKCAVLTAVGYRCPACGAERSAVATLGAPRLILGSLGGFIVAFALSYFVPMVIPFVLLLIFAGAIIGGFVGRMIHQAIGRKSSLWVGAFTALGFILGAMAESMWAAIEATDPSIVFSRPWPLVFGVIAAAVAWSQLR